MVYVKKFGVFFRHPAAEFGGWSPDLRRFLFRLRGRGATRRLSVGCHHGVAWAMTVWGLTPTRIEHGRKTKTRLLNLFEGQLLQPSWAWQLGGCQPASWIRIILFFYGHIVFFYVFARWQMLLLPRLGNFRRYLYNFLSVYKTHRATDFDLISSS